MIAVVVLITELERSAIDINQLNLVGGTETHIGAFPGIDVANNGLHEGAQVPRGAMVDFQNNGGVAIVFNRHPFPEIVCRSHFELVIGD
jgi:hypothetical protein